MNVQAIGRDPDLLEAFYREHVEAVQHFVARRVADRQLAADLTAEVFLAAIESAGSYRPGRGSPMAWLYGVARNVVSGELRRSGRERRAVGRLGGQRVLDGDDQTRMDERLDAAARARELYRAMERLSDGERAVLELTALDGLTVAEAAGALGIQPIAARVRLHRARRTLDSELRSAEDPDRPALTQPAEVAP
jgi:RNA polymerase sigma-70 factor (ECF subfamily)